MGRASAERIKLGLLRRRLGPGPLRRRWLLHDLLVRRRTVVSLARLRNLYRLCAARSLPAGALVECGVGLGGCTAVMAYAGGPQRRAWGFDSFEGMPPLAEEDEGDGQQWVGHRCGGPRGLLDARDTVARYALHNVEFIAGWFEDTLPLHAGRIGPIAVLRLDNDWFRSTRFCLEQLYAKVVPGGAIIIDDYHTFRGCRKAVDEYRARERIEAPLVTTERDSEAFWIKSR